MNSSWMEGLSLIFIDDFKNYYRELEDNKEVVLEELKAERVRFNRTLEKGLRKFEKVSDKDVDGTTAFHLFDTYGFPLELTIELAKEKGLNVDVEGYNQKFREHQELSRSSSQGKFKGGLAGDSEIETKYHTATHLLNAALKEVGTKLEILNDEFQHVHQYNPIEHIKTRIKTPESIVKKLKRYGYETSIENMVRYINDIAGVRLICSFTSDIYRLAEMIGNQSDLKVLSIKDYIKNPKDSGYKSYHMLVSVPIFLSDSVVDTKVEIQIRTIAMDFWASLEHKIYYKFEGNAPDYISRDLRECAKMVSELDDKMLSLNEAIQECIERTANLDNMDEVLDNVIGTRKEQKLIRFSDKTG